ncbi:MAG: hypothetical protein ACKV2V_14810 [Blastocatellia bacterium]
MLFPILLSAIKQIASTSLTVHSRVRAGLIPALFAILLAVSVHTRAQGVPMPATADASDMKLGSVLVFNYYTSGAANPGAENTRVSLTNHGAANATVHMFLIDGATGATADFYACLAAKQTQVFNASDMDPGISGYILAVATTRDGCPISHNALSGEAAVKLSTGHFGTLPAVAIAAVAATPVDACAADSATLLFDGVKYNRLPHQLSVDKLPSAADGNQGLLILNRLGGALQNVVPGIGSFTGSLYDASGAASSFTASGGAQFRGTFGVANFPAVPGGFSGVIPAGATGWMKLGNNATVPLLGAVFNFNANTATNATAFTGARNLRHLALSSFAALTIPVRVSVCQ